MLKDLMHAIFNEDIEEDEPSHSFSDTVIGSPKDVYDYDIMNRDITNTTDFDNNEEKEENITLISEKIKEMASNYGKKEDDSKIVKCLL